MKSIALIIAFILFWFFGSYIGMWLHPNFSTDYLEWQAMVIDRELIYEQMFVVSLLLGVFKTTRLSKSFCVFALVLVVSSIIDKKYHLQTSYAYYDPVVILFGIFFAAFIYRHGRN